MMNVMVGLVGALFFIALSGAFLQTIIGFGFPVLAMIFLPALFPFSTAVALCQIIAMASTAFLTIRYFSSINWRVLIPMLTVSLAIGIGVTISSITIPQQNLQIILGLALIIISIFTLRFSERIVISPTRTAGIMVGAIAGVGNGLFGIGGPQVAIYLLGAQLKKHSYIATIQCYFLISNISTIIIRTGYGALSLDDFPLIIAGWLGIGGGTFLALRVFERLPQSLLKRLVYAFVGISGLIMILQQIL